MTGLDKILEEIIAQAQQNADSTMSEAQLKVNDISLKAQAEAEKKVAKIEEHTNHTCKDILERGYSAAQLYKRQALLAAKQNIITSMLNDAHLSLISLDESKYFQLILKMIAKYSFKEDGCILFNKKDLNRLPKNFNDEIAKAAKAKLTVSKSVADIDGGFVLVYGDIEENCSFKALFNGHEEALQDKVHSLLFS